MWVDLVASSWLTGQPSHPWVCTFPEPVSASLLLLCCNWPNLILPPANLPLLPNGPLQAYCMSENLLLE